MSRPYEINTGRVIHRDPALSILIERLNNINYLASALAGKISDTEARILRADAITETLILIELSEHKVHEGDSYEITVAQDIDAGANLDLLIVTPNTTKWAHINMIADVEAEMMFYVYEDTDSTGGAAITPINQNRNSSNASGLTITSAPTVTSAGTQVRIAKAGSGNKVGGGAKGLNEFVLKQNTKYLFRINNPGVQAFWASQQLTWFEHTNKN